MSDELPNGWISAKLDDVVSFALGGDWGKEPDKLGDGMAKVRVVRGTEFKNWRRDKGASAAQRSIKVSSLEKRRLQEGDLVLEVSGGGPHQPVGRTVLIDDETLKRADAPLVCSNFFRLLRLHSEIEARFISHFLSYAYARGRFNDFQTETTNLRNLNVTDFLEKTEVALAPLPEQQRIVAKLETLLGKVDASQQRLAKIPVLLKRFRQSVLAAACSGRLTADWREQNPTDETIDATVEVIHLRRKAETKTDAQKEKLRKIFSVSEENDSGELAENWRFVALNKLCSSFDYGTSTKSQPSGKVPVLRMGNIQGGEIDWSDLVYTSDKREIETYCLKPSTVLFNRTNSPELVGKTAIYRGEQPAIFAGYLIRINPLPELNPEYLNFCLNTNYAREFCQSVKTDGVSQSNINAQKLRNFEVPFCPLPEQHEIVRRVEALFALADEIEARFEKAHAQVEKLTPSLLARAFAGKLVPQDPNDEPASTLLERIRLSHNGNETKQKRPSNEARFKTQSRNER